MATVSTFDEFCRTWGGTENLMLQGECVPFSYAAPPLEDVLDVLRKDADARLLVGGTDPNQHVRSKPDESWRTMPIEQFVEQPFSLGHFDLRKFSAKGKLLEGFEEGVLHPLCRSFETHGMQLSEWFKPYVFASGPRCCSTYHMDFSHVLAWQQYGVKHFCSLRDPDRWAPEELRRRFMDLKEKDRPRIPEGLTDEDIVDNVMNPGDVLWNAYLTPHWVCGEDGASLSINISFRGLRYRGALCVREQQVERWRSESPAPA